MDVWWSWCRRTAKCAFCEEPIEVATELVTGKMWRKGDENSRKISLWFYWHPECYVQSQKEYLEKNPYSPGNKRGPKIKLTPEQTKERSKLVRRWGAVLCRLNRLKPSHHNYILRTMELDKQLLGIAQCVDKLGGTPKSWQNKLDQMLISYSLNQDVEYTTAPDSDTIVGTDYQTGKKLFDPLPPHDVILLDQNDAELEK